MKGRFICYYYLNEGNGIICYTLRFVSEYIAGLGLAAMPCKRFEAAGGYDANYYFSGGILLIGSLLARTLTGDNLWTSCKTSINETAVSLPL